MEAFSAAYRAELKPFGVDVIVASMSDLEASGLETTAALARIDHGMTGAERKLYGKQLRACMKKLAGGRTGGEQITAAARVVELAVQRHAPDRAVIHSNAGPILRAVRDQTDVELDTLRNRLSGPT